MQLCATLDYKYFIKLYFYKKSNIVAHMKNKDLDQQILSIVLKDDGHLNASRVKVPYFSKNFPDLFNYLNERFSDLNINENLSEIIFRIKNNLDDAPICPVCGNKIPFIGKYNIVCSNVCKSSNIYKQIIQKKYEETCMKKYGVKNSFQCEEIKNKMRKTWTEKYGYDHPNKNKEQKNKGTQAYINRSQEEKEKTYKLRKQTCLEKYGDENYRNIEKTKQTCIERYGVNNVYQKIENKQKILEKYGVENVFANETIKSKIKHTFVEKYGVECVLQSKEIQEKIKQTNLERYGTEIPLQNKEIMNKMWETKRKRGSLKKSAPEEFLKQLFDNNDIEYKWNYNKDQRYPWHVDFYLSDYDLFIEIQGYWTHGSHPFNENDQNDIDRLNYMIQKNTKKYQQAINTWTISDPLKRKTAKENNLNYLEIFSCNENVILNQISDYFKEHFNIEINGEPT